MMRTTLVCCVALAMAPAAHAQSGVPAGERWEIEGYAGLSLARLWGDSSLTLPPPGAPLPTTSPVFPTRQVPSWFFGDGAALLNDVLSEFGLGARLLPLDAALASAPATPARTVAGARVRRTLGPQYSLEVGLDVAPGSSTLPADLMPAADAARDTFVEAITALFASGPFADPAVDAIVTAREGSGRDVAVTVGVERRLGGGAALQPYATVGAGALFFTGNGASVTLEGRYRADIAASVPIAETDRVTIRNARGAEPVGVFGGGVRRSLSSRWGLRVDARVTIGRSTSRLVVDASPDVAVGTPAGFIESGTSPAVQFSNNPTTGRTSSLSGQLRDVTLVPASGISTRVLLTVGVFWR